MSASQTPDRQLYELLPAVHQIRDQQHGEPLRALLKVISEQTGHVRSDIDRLYENWFIETCDDWVVPYIADLIGFRSVDDSGEPADALPSGDTALNRFLFPRREVANTLGLKRRKGTLAILEELAFQVAGWKGRAVEFENQVFTTPSLKYLHCGYGRTVDLRSDETNWQNPPFNTIHHTVDVNSMQSRPGVGWYHPFNVGLFVWRRDSYSVTHSQPKCVEGQHAERSARYFSIDPLGMDIPLHIKPQREEDPHQIAQPVNLPMRLTRDLLDDNGRASTEFYGLGKSVVILENDLPIPAEYVVPADLSSTEKCFRKQNSCNGEEVCLDPETGRFLFARNRPTCDLRVTWHYGFVKAMGGGEYDRDVPARPGYDVKRIAPEYGDCAPFDLTSQLGNWLPGSCEPNSKPSVQRKRLAVPCDIGFELTRSDNWRLDDLEELRICAGATLELRAANRTRPVIELGGTTHDCEPALKIVMEAGSRLILNGLLLFGDTLNIVYCEPDHDDRVDPCQSEIRPSGCPDPCDCRDDNAASVRPTPPRIDIRHCTLFPGGRPSDACGHCGTSNTSLRLRMEAGRVTVSHSIIGSIDVRRPKHAQSCGQDGDDAQQSLCPVYDVDLCIEDSIVDGCRRPPVIGAGCCGIAHASLIVRRTTILGSVRAERIHEAENSIFYGYVHVRRKQEGYMRFCFVPRDHRDVRCSRGCSPDEFRARTPVRFKCQPDSAGVASDHSCDPTRPKPANAKNREPNVHPKFVDTTYGHPGYCQLALDCPSEISGGAESESEMGAFHNLFVPMRTARLRQQLADFTPANMRSAIIYADDLEQHWDTNYEVD